MTIRPGSVIKMHQRNVMTFVFFNIVRGKIAQLAMENVFVGMLATVMLQLTRKDSELEYA